MAPPETPKKVAIIGTGIIGRSWAMVFIDAKYTVAMYDLDGYIIQDAVLDMRKQWFYLREHKLNKVDELNDDRIERIAATISLKEALDGAIFVMECVPENLEVKRKVWKEIDAIVGPDVMLASSASAMLPSSFSEHLKNRKNFLVAHPVNPPYYIPLVELVPAPWTDKGIVEKIHDFLEDHGMSPVVLKKEIPGYVNNRLQVTLLNEMICLLNEGVIEPRDLDKVMKDGLGRRYAFLGVLEVAFLNANGFLDYIKQYGPAIEAVVNDLRPPIKYVKPISDHILLFDEIRKDLDSDEPFWHNFELRMGWRDFGCRKLVYLKKETDELKKGKGFN